MKKTAKPLVYFIFVTLALSGCSGSGGGGGPVFRVETITETGLSNEDVYVVFTNPSPTAKAPSSPDVLTSLEARNLDETQENNRTTTFENYAVVDPQLWKTPKGYKATRNVSRSARLDYAFTTPQDDNGDDEVVDSPKTFFTASDIDANPTVQATCRLVRPVGEKTLVIYVADDCWDTISTKSNDVDASMVTAMADRFLPDDGSDGIWSWVTDIYQEPWGYHEYNNLIDEEFSSYMTILLYDIENDDGAFQADGGIVGYFNSLNNVTSINGDTDIGSNARLMFAMDALMFADDTDNDGTWEDNDDFWPQTTYSTLAHEFQHMIHFYQKQIVNGIDTRTDTWLNEMCSLVTEDLVADKIGVPGPRGVDPPTTGGAGNLSNDSSLLSEYNYWSDASLTDWGNTGGGVFSSYAAAYSFGAYVARNYGGASLMRSIVQNSMTDEAALLQAINDTASVDRSFEFLLVEWGVAVLMSDTIGASETYNTSSMITSMSNGTSFNLGSINFYNYRRDGENYGPWLYGYIDPAELPSLQAPHTPPASNAFFLLAKNQSGDRSWDVEVPTGMVYTVVRK